MLLWVQKIICYFCTCNKMYRLQEVCWVLAHGRHPSNHDKDHFYHHRKFHCAPLQSNCPLPSHNCDASHHRWVLSALKVFINGIMYYMWFIHLCDWLILLKIIFGRESLFCFVFCLSVVYCFLLLNTQHNINMPSFVYPCWWAFELLPFFGSYKYSCLSILIQFFLYEYMY